jgi:hypothetical protein
MDNAERTNRYAMMGVISYVQELVIAHNRKHDKMPALAVIGKLECEILGAKAHEDDFSIAGVTVVPDPTRPVGAFLIP